MSTPLETILSGDRAPAPSPEPKTEEKPQVETTQETQAETPPQPTPQQPEETEPQADNDGRVPIAALQAERGKTKRYTEQVAEFQKELTAMREQNAKLLDAIATRQQPPQPAQPQQQEQPVDFWADPEAAIKQMMRPVFEQFQMTADQRFDAVTRAVAETVHKDKVKEAEDAFLEAYHGRQLSKAEYEEVSQAPNRYMAVVNWFTRRNAMSEIGNDPEAYKARLREQILAELTQEQGNGNGAARPAPVMPSNLAAARNVGSRSGPAWAGPTPLNSIFKT